MAKGEDADVSSTQAELEYWAEQARRIEWQAFPRTILDDAGGDGPAARWFPDGQTNLCFNAVDRHAQARPEAVALRHVSSETNETGHYTYAQLRDEVCAVAAMLVTLGVGQGDRVLIYMPMIPQAVFAMLACARIGAVHVVVFGGFATDSLAARIADAKPAAVLTADAGSRGGKIIPYKPLLDAALARVPECTPSVVVYDRQLADAPHTDRRDFDWMTLRSRCAGRPIDCVWLPSGAPSYVLHTSGTTGTPKGVQRDVGGYAVALATAAAQVFHADRSDVFFTASDIGWVVGHSFIVYAPLLIGATTLLYEGTPLHPDPNVLWRICAEHRVTLFYSAPTALRVLRKQAACDPAAHDLSALRGIFVAGEPLDEATAAWIQQASGKPVIDNYWQTETGWPILAVPWHESGAQAGQTSKLGSCGRPQRGYVPVIVDPDSGTPLPAGEKGLLALRAPLPPGCLTTLWQAAARYRDTYWTVGPDRTLYSTFDWAVRDANGDFMILGRTDDIINVAGHRIGTREIEAVLNGHPAIAESAVVGVHDEIKGQTSWAFVVRREQPADGVSRDDVELAASAGSAVDRSLGAIARPSRVIVVPALPKTRSGKVVRRSLQAVSEGRDVGDISTVDDARVLDAVRAALASPDARLSTI
ncbi:propionate--CoA ligase [Chitinasiproducens palmae]|uniref:Propionyl-CoA synthetase n=1 Tax=Chitinasiproducens palmae TaxID=1770053 RepID=A0A1H2PSQ9_9BURK|nr:propionate--CoA ligase [Chitinasiproducens palmae]SDV49638.1 propionyl-CoA synthetase [Chitinasiproducens palmae]